MKRQNLIAAVNARKKILLVLEVEQAHKRLLLHHVLEEELGGVVGGDAGGQDAADAAPVVQQAAHALGEDGIDVDVAPAAERVATAVAQEVAFALGLARVFEELPIEAGVAALERLDQPLAGGSVGRVGDLGAALGKPLLLLELHALPRRIAEHAVEAALGEHLREGQVPVEELVLARKALDLGC